MFLRFLDFSSTTLDAHKSLSINECLTESPSCRSENYCLPKKVLRRHIAYFLKRKQKLSLDISSPSTDINFRRIASQLLNGIFFRAISSFDQVDFFSALPRWEARNLMSVLGKQYRRLRHTSTYTAKETKKKTLFQ